MKLNEKYENYLLEKASKEGGRDFKRFTNTIFNRIKEDPNISRRKIRKLTKQLPLNYQSYIDFIDTSLAVAPIVNYVSQPADVRKNKISKGLKRQIATLTKNAKFNLKNPKQTVDRAYSIISDMKKGQKDDVHKDFTRYLNAIAPERERIMQEARERLRKNTKFFKKSLTDDLYKDYQDYIDLGFGKPDAIAKTLSDNKIKNDHRIKRYLETEAHEDYEKAKIENAERNGFKYKYWRTQRDGRVRRSHQLLDGKIVKHDEEFKVGKSKAKYPGDSSLPIEERINCRCSTEFAFVPRGSRKGYTIGTRSSGDLILRPEEIQRYKERPEELDLSDVIKLRNIEYKNVWPVDFGKTQVGEFDKLMQGEVSKDTLDTFFRLNNPQMYFETVEEDGIEYELTIAFSNSGSLYSEIRRKGEDFGGLRRQIKPGDIYQKNNDGYYLPTKFGNFKIADDPGTDVKSFMADKIYRYKPDAFKYDDGYEPVLAKKESLADADRFEEDIPYTLINLRDNEERYIEEQIERGEAQFFFANNDEEEVKKAEFVKNVVESTLDQHRFAMRVNSEQNKGILRKIFGGEGFKNIQETGEGFGLSDVDYRTRVSERLFGTPPRDMFEDIDESDYERYGYLADRDIKKEIVGDEAGDMKVAQYGRNIVVFKKDRLAERTTFTLGDSFTHAMKSPFTSNIDLNAMAQPVTSVNPQFMAFEGSNEERKTVMYEILKQKVDESYQIRRERLLDQRTEDTARFVDEELEKLEKQRESGHLGIVELAKAQADMQVSWRDESGDPKIGFFPNYIELQYHGPLTIEDVAEVHLGKTLLLDRGTGQKVGEEEIYQKMFEEMRQIGSLRDEAYQRNTLRTLRDTQQSYGVRMFVPYMRNTGKRNENDLPIYEQDEFEVDLQRYFTYADKATIEFEEERKRQQQENLRKMVEEEFDDSLLIELDVNEDDDMYDETGLYDFSDYD